MDNQEDSKAYDYAIHSDYLIHWTGKDLDKKYDPDWHSEPHSRTKGQIEDEYLKRLRHILKFGLWMTEEPIDECIIPWPKCSFTELKVSELRKHAKNYGRLGIGVKRRFLFDRFGRPLVYFGFHSQSEDKLRGGCARDLTDRHLMNFFKPMNVRGQPLTYELYSESEWRIIFFEELLKETNYGGDKHKLIVDPSDKSNTEEHQYFQSLSAEQKEKLKYLIPLDGWFQLIIYPSLSIKNKAQQIRELNISDEIKRIKKRHDHGNAVEKGNWPVEVDLDACRQF